MSQVWKVVGGVGFGGVIVRSGVDLDAPKEQERLKTGAVVRQLDISGDRMCYELLSGLGPLVGWVSLRVKDKELLVPEGTASPLPADQAPPAALPPEPPEPLPVSAGTRHPVLGVAAGAPGRDPASEKAPGKTVAVRVLNMAGDKVASVALHSTSCILDLKERLAESCGVGPQWQQLLPVGPTGSMRVLDNNGLLSSLGDPATVLLVKLTERRDWFKLQVHGMWSLCGIKCALSATLETTADEVKELVHRAANISPEAQELDVNGMPWERKRTLEQVLYRAPSGEGPVTVYLFARAHPERQRLLADVKAGRMSAEHLASLDPDALMPAC